MRICIRISWRRTYRDAGYAVGTVFTYQQNHKNSETYLEDLKAIGYDILYGKYYLYGGKNPFEPTDMKMGVKV